MEFRTQIALPTCHACLTPEDRTIFIGSCFAENIGQKFRQNKLPCLVNPFGVLYNPASIRLCLEELFPYFQAEDYFFRQSDLWFSWLHSSLFSAENADTLSEKIQNLKNEVKEEISRAHTLFITLGTNKVYRLRENGQIVGNCHQEPGIRFQEDTLSMDECTAELNRIVSLCLTQNKELHIVFTVSPYRYAKYGFHQSQLSKAILLLAIDEVCRSWPENCSYFPAYEIVLDELRDYRFYKEDMLHPSEQAVTYIWECVQKTYFDKSSISFMNTWQEIRKAMEHRPLHPGSEKYQTFLSKTLLKLENIQKNYPNLALSYEFDWFSSRLKK